MTSLKSVFFFKGLVTANDNMDKLMSRLERLSVAIGELNPAASAPTTPSSGFSKKSDKDEISWPSKSPGGDSIREKRKRLTRQKESLAS